MPSRLNVLAGTLGINRLRRVSELASAALARKADCGLDAQRSKRPDPPPEQPAKGTSLIGRPATGPLFKASCLIEPPDYGAGLTLAGRRLDSC